MGARFARYLGIDYSGASFPTKGVPGIRVFETRGRGEAREIRAREPVRSSWSRQELRSWLVELSSPLGRRRW